MSAIRHLLAAVLMLGSLCLLPGNARAETYNTCAGFIDSLPVTISTQGVWCLRQDLATSMTSGSAINITTNNVTIDCNDFKIGGLAAGNTSTTHGIYANGRQNVTVRHCAIRGFYYGIAIYGGAGQLVEDNRLDNNLFVGIRVSGDNNRVQRNRVYDTGGYPGAGHSYGIWVSADAIDNTVAGVFATATNSYPHGIHLMGDGNDARGNQVRGLVVTGTGSANGIFATGSGSTLANNQVSQVTATMGSGIEGFGVNLIFCTGNTVANFSTPYWACDASSDNLSLP